MTSEADARPVELAGILDQTARIVGVYVVTVHLSRDELTEIIVAVARALRTAAAKAASDGKELIPAVSPGKSVTPDFLICLEDGKKLKMLKRHLLHSYAMTPRDYRLKWGLPPDYPMVAPNYAALRSRIAKEVGLGRPSRKPRSGRVPRLAA